MRIRIVEAYCRRISSIEIALLKLRNAGNVRAEYVFAPCVDFHAALFRGGYHQFQAIYIAVIRCLFRLERSVSVVLHVRRCIHTSVTFGEILILLDAVIWEWMSFELTACNAGAIAEGAHEECIHAGLFLQNVEHFFCAFIEERDRVNLNADDWFFRQLRHSRGGLVLSCIRRRAQRAKWLSVARFQGSYSHPGAGQKLATINSAHEEPVLEVDFGSRLEDAVCVQRAGDFAGRRRADSSIRSGEGWVVGEIEALKAHLKLTSLRVAEVEHLLQSHVKVGEAVGAKDIAAGVAIGI